MFNIIFTIHIIPVNIDGSLSAIVVMLLEVLLVLVRVVAVARRMDLSGEAREERPGEWLEGSQVVTVVTDLSIFLATM